MNLLDVQLAEEQKKNKIIEDNFSERKSCKIFLTTLFSLKKIVICVVFLDKIIIKY